MLETFKKYKERFALAGTGMAFVLFIVGGIYLKNTNRQEKASPSVPERVELPHDQQKKNQQETASTASALTTYYLKPSPDELLQQLASMENLKADVIDEKIAQLPVLWPAYFFTIEQSDTGQKSIVLDVSENGFGVVIESEIDSALYPELLELKVGEKVWLGGKIMAVDPTGTGRIYLTCEQFRIGDEGSFVQFAGNH